MMKRLLLTFSLIATFQTSSAAELLHTGSVFLNRTQILNLKELGSDTSINLGVAYPGRLQTGLCALELRSSLMTDELIEKLLTKVSLHAYLNKKIPLNYKVINGAVTIPLSEGTFVDGIGLTSLSGKPLSEIVSETFGNENLVAVAKLCEE